MKTIMILNLFSCLLKFVTVSFTGKRTDTEVTNDTIHTFRRLLFVFLYTLDFRLHNPQIK